MKGIYQYLDLETDEIVYIGKDSNISSNKRHTDHFKPSQYNIQQINRVLQNNPNRYEYSVLYCSENVTDSTLNRLEMSFIERYDPKFNFTKGGDGSTGRIVSDETKKKISESLTGFKRSEETRKKISEGHKGQIAWNTGKKMSDDICHNLSKSHNTSGYLRVYIARVNIKSSLFHLLFAFRHLYILAFINSKLKSISLQYLFIIFLSRNHKSSLSYQPVRFHSYIISSAKSTLIV